MKIYLLYKHKWIEKLTLYEFWWLRHEQIMAALKGKPRLSLWGEDIGVLNGEIYKVLAPYPECVKMPIEERIRCEVGFAIDLSKHELVWP